MGFINEGVDGDDCLVIFLLIVEFQWFLIALSVLKCKRSNMYSNLPGSSFAISAHLFPSRWCASNIFLSSSGVHASFLMSGFKWLCHLLGVKKWNGQ